MMYEMNNFLNTYDKRTNDTLFCSWDELTAIFKNHSVSTTKDYKMYNLCNLKRDENNVHCIADNVVSYNCLVLDYDDKDATIEWACNKFNGFTYLGYTSYNHVIKGVDKFRLIFPFSSVCPAADWNSRKEQFLSFAERADRSTIATSRVFYMPSCSAENLQYADSWSCEGTMLDWNVFPAKQVRYAAVLERPIETSIVTEALDELKKHRYILPNEDRFWLGHAVARCVGVSQAMIEMQCRWPDAQYNGKYADTLKRFKQEGPAFTRIIAEIRKYNPNYGNSIIDVSKFKKIKERI